MRRCGVLFPSIGDRCGGDVRLGLRRRMLFIRFEDVDRRRSVITGGYAVDLHLLPYCRGEVVDVPYGFAVNGKQLYSGGKGYLHELSFRVDNRPVVGDFATNAQGAAGVVEALRSGSWVVVVETAAGAWEVLGFEAGLVLRSAERDFDRNGVRVVLGTDANNLERYFALQWYVSGMSEDTQRDLFDGELDAGRLRVFDRSFDNSFE
jgi:hypothetical protein